VGGTKQSSQANLLQGHPIKLFELKMTQQAWQSNAPLFLESIPLFRGSQAQGKIVGLSIYAICSK
jgi:hypothetical protein